MDNRKVTYAEKTEQELVAIIQSYLTGNAPELRDDAAIICQVLAARKMPPADPAEIYRQQLAACFPDAIKAEP